MNNTSHITLLIDRSGSMEQIRSDAEGAINSFLADQKQEPLPCTLLVADFSAGNDFGRGTEPFGIGTGPQPRDSGWYKVVYTGDLQGMTKYTLRPNGGTALYDAMSRAIRATGEQLAGLPEDQRPSKVFFVVETDGEENGSRYTTLEQLVGMIKHQEETYSWTFIFLASGPDAWAQSNAFQGTQIVANTVAYGPTAASYGGAHAHTSSNIRTARAGGQSVNYGATVSETGEVEDTTNRS